jgi:hypothetical protein
MLLLTCLAVWTAHAAVAPGSEPREDEAPLREALPALYLSFRAP